MLSVFSLIQQRVSLSFHLLQERALRWIKPVTTSFVLGTLADLTRGKAALLAENALLRQQLICVIHRFLSMSQSNMAYRCWLAQISPGTVLEDRLAYSRFPWISHGS